MAPSPIFAVLAILILAAGATTSIAAPNDKAEDSVVASTNYAKAVKAIESQQYHEAIEYLRAVFFITPRDPNMLNYMGYSYRKIEKYDKAIDYYKRALEEDPNHLGANEYLGETYLETDKLSLAEQRLATLKSACGDCEEYQDLKKDIAGYKAPH
jgi:tetratricopeptide (TPR) repeat protein